MLTEKRKATLLQKMQTIFQTNNLTHEEIIAFLEMGDADYSDKRLHNASDQVAELVGEERVSFDDLMMLIKLCREVELEKMELV